MFEREAEKAVDYMRRRSTGWNESIIQGYTESLTQLHDYDTLRAAVKKMMWERESTTLPPLGLIRRYYDEEWARQGFNKIQAPECSSCGSSGYLEAEPITPWVDGTGKPCTYTQMVRCHCRQVKS